MAKQSYGIDVLKSNSLCTFCMSQHNEELFEKLFDWQAGQLYACDYHWDLLKELTTEMD